MMVCLTVDNAGWGPTGSAVQHGDSQEQDWRHGAQSAQQVGPYFNVIASFVEIQGFFYEPKLC